MQSAGESFQAGKRAAPVAVAQRIVKAIARDVGVRGIWRASLLQEGEVTATQTAMLRGFAELRAGDSVAAQAEAARPCASAQLILTDGRSLGFTYFHDGYYLAALLIETMTGAGEHILMPIERIASPKLEPPTWPVNLCWRRAAIAQRDGTEGAVGVPALSPASRAQRPTKYVLFLQQNRKKARSPSEGGCQQRIVADGERQAVADIAAIEFAAPA